MPGCRHCPDGLCFCRPELPELQTAPAPIDPDLLDDADLYDPRSYA